MEVGYHCSICDSSFVSMQSLNKHSCSDKRETLCLWRPMCNKAFSSEHIVKVHLSEHTRTGACEGSGEKAYPCAICGITFSRARRLRKHKRKKCFSGKDTMQCDICEAVFHKPIHLVVHRLIHTRKSYQCGNCYAEYNSPHGLSMHVRSHAIKKRHKCVMCRVTFHTTRSLRLHKLNHSDLSKARTRNMRLSIIMKRLKHSGPYKICRRKGNISNMSDHKEYICKQCGAKFPNFDSCNAHIEKTHNITRKKPRIKSESHQCPWCESEFRYKAWLEKHIFTHTGENDYATYDLYCRDCNMEFQNKSLLIQHMRKHHGTNRDLFTCSVCEATFRHRESVRRHEMIHTGEKPYECTICQMRFNQSAHLKTHNLIHTGEKSHQCSICGTTFRHKGNLTMHVRKHTGEKLFRCKDCDATYVRADYYKKHIQKHSVDEIKYQCTVCKATFCKQNLARHMETHDNDTDMTFN